VLCLHLARLLRERRAPGEPAPVLLSFSGWDPATVGLHEWIAARLPVDVAPGLAEDAGDGRRATGDGRSVARAMVDGGHLVPILDGLDELPASTHRAAVEAINAAPPGPLVLTSRRAEFAAATALDRGTAAAVVRVEPLPPSAVAQWLHRTAPPLPEGTTTRSGTSGCRPTSPRSPGRARRRRPMTTTRHPCEPDHVPPGL
jgi:hypothetical protein